MSIPTRPFFAPIPSPLRLLVAALAVQTIGAFAAGSGLCVERLAPPQPTAGDVTIRETVPGAVPGVTAGWITIVGPACYVEPGTDSEEVVWLTLGGRATFHAGGRKYALREESIARAPLGWSWTIEVPAGSTLLCVQVRHAVSAEDRGEYPRFAESNREPYVRTFRECEASPRGSEGTEAFARPLLPENMVPRMSVRLVEPPGPGRVAQPGQPMLDRFLIGLGDNLGRISVGETQIDFPPLSILHIPRGSPHSTEADTNHKRSYLQLDFLPSREGEHPLLPSSAAPAPASP